MHDKRYVWFMFMLFLSICIVNSKRLSYSYINANLIDSVKNQKIVTSSKNEGYDNLNTKRSDQHRNINNEKEIYGETSLTELTKSRNSQDERKKKKKDMFTRLLPMFIIPYLVQSAMLPMMLVSLKLMLLKSFLVGKLAVILGIFNMLRSRNSSENKEVENYGSTGSADSYGYGHYGKSERESEEMSMNVLKQYYGYNGNEEFGAWIHH